LFNIKGFTNNLLQLNFAVLLISTSGALGRFITLDPVVTIFYRCLLAAVVFYFYLRWKKIPLKVRTRRDIFKFMLSGVLMGAHWVTYFYSLKFSNVAIALLSLFTYPVITSLLEPIVFKTRFNKFHITLGVLVLLGIYYLSPDFDLENNSFVAVILGIISAIFYALRNILMKKEITRYDGSTLMFYQIVVVAIMLSPVFFYSEITNVVNQWKPLLTLALLTTCLGHTLFLKSFKNFTVTAASIMSSIQPVYGILLAALFLGEMPRLKTLLGGGLILSAVILESLSSLRNSNSNK